MHKLQKLILNRLKYKNNQRYGTLVSGYDFEDNIVFHLNKLLADKYISKQDGVYSITLLGVKEIAHYEPIDLEDKGVKSFFIGFLCSDEEGNFLIKSHTNAKAEFYNLPSGKPFFGETIEVALTRSFQLNTGLCLLDNDFNFTSLHLKTIRSSEGEVIFDDAFTIYSVKINKDQKARMSLIDSISWKSINNIKCLTNRWPEIDICILENDLSVYKTYIHVSNYIL